MNWPDTCPELIDGDVRVRPMTKDDIGPKLVAWLSDPIVTRFSNQRFRKHSVEACASYLGAMREGRNWYGAIECDGQFVGTLSAHLNRHHATADIGILLGDREFWGRRVGTRAWCLWADAVSALPGLRKLTAGTLDCNEPMLRSMAKSGFRLEARLAQQELVDGEPHDILLHARFP